MVFFQLDYVLARPYLVYAFYLFIGRTRIVEALHSK